MLVEALQAAGRIFYHVLDGEVFEQTLDASLVRGFVFDPPADPEGTVVLVHGLGDASSTWYRLVPLLRRRFRVIAPDLPPFGLSELTDGYARKARHLGDLVARISQGRTVGSTTLVGHSLGGWVAQWALHDHGELFDQGVLVAPGGAELEGSFDAIATMSPHSPEQALAYLDTLWHERPAALNAVVGEILDRLHSPQVRGFLALTDREDALDEAQLGAITTPVHIVWGASDRLLDPRTPAHLAGSWGAPTSRSYLARAAHMVHMERPRAVGRIVRHAAGLD